MRYLDAIIVTPEYRNSEHWSKTLHQDCLDHVRSDWGLRVMRDDEDLFEAMVATVPTQIRYSSELYNKKARERGKKLTADSNTYVAILCHKNEEKVAKVVEKFVAEHYPPITADNGTPLYYIATKIPYNNWNWFSKPPFETTPVTMDLPST